VVGLFAAMAAAQGEAAHALRLAGAASALRTSIGSPLSPAEQKRLDDYLEPARRTVPSEGGQALFEQGAEMGLERAIAEAVKQ